MSAPARHDHVRDLVGLQRACGALGDGDLDAWGQCFGLAPPALSR